MSMASRYTEVSSSSLLGHSWRRQYTALMILLKNERKIVPDDIEVTASCPGCKNIQYGSLASNERE
ncbi:hypothetical protein OnM2_042058 [Erysiphe neolycopersici]|uniref:Uncharacterized protein n=1 Tax=Erysiphe neolycopersici TaxID=212602 RepID=A0A420HVF7_9PEZI|nr:hypothetical protein OnM2_042058 [Erysiphe neolycopersici]